MKGAVYFLAAVLACQLGVAHAADVAGSKDPAGFKRFQGSEIIDYTTRSYDAYNVANSLDCDVSPSRHFINPTVVEGEVTRLLYRVPAGHTAIEVERNYQQMLADLGFAKGFEVALPGDFRGDWFWDSFYFQNGLGGYFRPYEKAKNAVYFTAKGTKDGKDWNVAVLAAESGALDWNKPKADKPVPIEAGAVLVFLDVVTAKALQQQMVEVKAADMADALATKGMIDLYGIYFDVDKTAIKPESTKTLDEVASLLKIDRSLKLEISGHTDNTGTADHNMKLSEGRAQAVVDALTKNYGIDPARLQAKGYGDTKPVASNDTDDGRAKNRRVELKKL